MNNFFSRLIPFITFGVMLVMLVAGLVLLSYILIYGAIIGFCLFGLVWIKEKLFPRPPMPKPESQGRVIDHDQLK